jgi:rhamnosyltransferase
MKSVCVLLSTYNGEKYLKELLDSVLNQNCEDKIKVSIFVRDDGSSDNTTNILKEYEQNGKIILFGHGGCNLGFAKSFSSLLANAPLSDYYAFCDQDDIWLPDKLISAVERLEKEDNNEIPLLYSTNLIVVDKDLNEITRDTHIHMTKNPKHQ